jgi:tRNA(His) guanylyltransferase
MKEYEIYNNLKVPSGSKLILRLDGRNFHRLTNKLDLNRPYDENFINTMVLTAKDIFKEFSPLLIYIFSDEINILLSEIPFSGRIEKLNSVFPSLAASSLSLHLTEFFTENIKNIISFDSRAIPISNDEDIVKYFKWRQDEAWRNCVNSYGYWTLRKNFSSKIATEKLQNLKSAAIHELLFERGINLNDLPKYQKRGIAIYKEKKEIVGLNPKTNKEESSYRNYIFVDKNLDIFDQEFFKKIDII